jgi:hypothetical protein
MKKLSTIILAVLLGCLSVIAQDRAVETKGYGQNRNDAIADGLRSAVGQAMGTTVQAESNLENFILVKDVVSTRTEGYIKSYEVVSENRGANGITEVILKALVSLSPLRADAVMLSDMVGGIRFMAIYDPRKTDAKELSAIDFGIERINEFLADKKYRYIEKNRFDQLKNEAYRIFKDGDTSETSFVQKLGLMSDAQFIIYIKDITIRSERNAAGAFNTKVLLEAKAYDNCTAEGLGTVVLEGGWQALPDQQAAIKMAVTDAVAKGMDRLLFLFNSYMGQWVNNGMPYELRFYNAGTFRDFRNLRRKLTNDPEFGGNMEPVSVANYTKLNVTFKKKPADLTDKILDYCDEDEFFKPLRMDVELLYGRQISFSPTKNRANLAQEVEIPKSQPSPQPSPKPVETQPVTTNPRNQTLSTPPPPPTQNLRNAPAKPAPKKTTRKPAPKATPKK